MKREDVKRVLPAITDEELDSLMKLHGDSVNGYKARIAGLEDSVRDMENGIKERDERLTSFEGLDLEKLKNDEYTRAYAAAKNEFEQYKMTHALDDYIKASGARNITAVKSLLSMEGVGFENGTITGLDEQLEKVIAENPYLFETQPLSQKPSFTSQIEGAGSAMSRDAFQKMGYRDRLRLYNDNPALYDEMNN